MLGTSTWGGSDIGEVDRIGRLLKAVPRQTDEAWFDVCVKIADETRAHAAGYEKKSYRVSAAPFYLRACKHYQMAERFAPPRMSARWPFTSKASTAFTRSRA